MNKLKHWSNAYWNQIKRNVGLLTIEEQEKIRKTSIAIFGLGGLGGPIAEQLVRTGCEELVICDNDKFEESNLNRQICTREDIGKYKVDITEDFLKKINPNITIYKYFEINEKNISKILNNISIATLTLDDPLISILISRECLKKKILLIESWGIPYICAWWFTSKSVDYETCYGFNTQKLTIEEIKSSKEITLNIKKAMLNKIMQFPNIKETYDREKGALKDMLSGKLDLISLAPIIMMTASYMTFEIIFSGILNVKEMVLAPNIVGYDYLRMVPIMFSFK